MVDAGLDVTVPAPVLPVKAVPPRSFHLFCAVLHPETCRAPVLAMLPLRIFQPMVTDTLEAPLVLFSIQYSMVDTLLNVISLLACGYVGAGSPKIYCAVNASVADEGPDILIGL